MADDIVDAFPKLETVYKGSGYKFNRFSGKVTDTKLEPEQTAESKVIPNVWSCSNVIQKLTKRGNGGSGLVTKGNNIQEKSYSPKTDFAGSVNGVLNGSSKSPPQEVCSSVEVDTTTFNDFKDGQCKEEGITKPLCEENNDVEISESDSDIVFDSDDDLSLDDTDSDTGEKAHEGSKKSKWFRKFFDDLNKLTVEEMSSQARKWHCPACQGGPGAIDWYHGLQPLLNHSRTIQVRRARLHRAFAETLEVECSIRGAPLIVAGEAYGLWEGLDKKVKDHQIVWPPMVVIMNTKYEQDENNKWTGMGNQELLDCFSDYAALKARHSYGPKGHRGMSVLIFDESAAGYLESVRLHKHFKEQGRDREAWDRCKNPFVPGVKRQLYGYLASREDLDVFNKHSGKSKLKFEMQSYQEMVESRIKHINDDVQQLEIFKDKIAKEQLKSKVLEDTLCKVGEKLRETTKEIHVVREGTIEHHQQNKEEMEAQETFLLDQIQSIDPTIAAKEDKFEKPAEDSREVIDSSVKENSNHILENTSSFMKSQDNDMMQYEAERDTILKMHEEKQLALKKKQWQEQVELENELENELNQLKKKYALSQPEEENCQINGV